MNDALHIVQARLDPAATLRSDPADTLYPCAVVVHGVVVGRSITWRTLLRKLRLTCDERAGYGFHFCTRPDGHPGECRCWCGEGFSLPF